MAILTCGYSLSGRVLEYTTMAAALAAGSSEDTVVFGYGSAARTLTASFLSVKDTKGLTWVGALPDHGVILRSTDGANALITDTAGVPWRFVNLRVFAPVIAYISNANPGGAVTQGFDCCVLVSSPSASQTVYFQANGNLIALCRNCAAVTPSLVSFGFSGSVYATHLTAMAINCTAYGSTGFSSAGANGVFALHNCLGVDNVTASISANFDEVNRCAANTAPGALPAGATFSLLAGNSIPRQVDPSDTYGYALPIDHPMIGAGYTMGYTLPYDIDYKPWPGGVPSIGCSAGVDLNPKYRKGVFGRNRLNYRVGDYVHPDAPWIKYASYIN
jgi:hypothetical protein